MVETEKLSKYDLLANDLGLIYRGLESGINAGESWESASIGVFKRVGMHEEPTPSLKQDRNDEYGVKEIKAKKYT
ncbi:hypothetical protein CWI38_1700p0010 [Hamiltosporidium tvaerminnensis]|uniref:Uncharacterized protein n=1 Tax=Hamiltosporidium tvaerminnensis TaxID=1176355 RepID=A0A4Q9LPV7_9MICR|nr:hypothetical protein CWI38_1700p0010 [Hamiltosporidium tvaerminnensis]